MSCEKKDFRATVQCESSGFTCPAFARIALLAEENTTNNLIKLMRQADLLHLVFSSYQIVCTDVLLHICTQIHTVLRSKCYVCIIIR